MTTPWGTTLVSDDSTETNTIREVTLDGNVSVWVEGVSKPASLAFGQGDYDPCSLYVTNLLGAQVWRVGIGVLEPEN